MEEIWRTIPDINEKYLISNKNGWKNIEKKEEYQPKGIIIDGYRRVSISRNKRMFYHVLVAKAFPEICGEWYEGCQVHHINFDSLDNRPENLIVLSPSEHSKLHYKRLPDTFKKPSKIRSKSIANALKGRRNTHLHKPILQLKLNGELVKEWECIADVVQKGYSPGNICYCCKGKLKSAYGYLWKYKEAS